ncbi:MBL fold metallo-hydrolase [Haloarchaeobius sp. DFWS5]|uniref:MBL fold metallo-hydrolase n=1 Tax=Haloarchaeobius sp. DFWS5 TaxID=3446114 RepID=UPI003EC00EE0
MTTRLADGVWQIPCRGVSVYLVEDGDDLTLVDAGTPWDAAKIESGVRDAGYTLSDIDRCLCTHYDMDHVGAYAKLQPDLRAPIVAGEHTAAVLRGDRKPDAAGAKGFLTRHVSRRLVTLPDLPVESVADGDRAGSFVAFSTPGHTPGHTAFVSPDLGVALLGDLVSGDDDGTLGRVPRFFDADRDQSAASIRDLAERAPEFEIACMGHGSPLRDMGAEQLRRLAARV